MQPLVECVPNFSEGRNHETIDAIGKSIQSVSGVKLLSLEPDRDYNRTVVTFAGHPEAAVEAAFLAAQIASERIDMTHHSGEHPRIGAIDVVPFIPLHSVSMESCVRLAHAFGKRVAAELGIPVYLYEYAAQTPQRKNLSDIRKGEYEELPKKLHDPLWRPDYGAPLFNAKSGALVTGARQILIAYNINLKTKNERLANEIALRIRESGRPAKDEFGKPIKDEHGEAVRIPGTLKAVKALGVFLQRYTIAQVSINLVDYTCTSMHEVYEEVKKQAHILDIEVTGSELVGLAPLDAFIRAGIYYANGRTLTEAEYVDCAVQHLGLHQLEPFDPKKKIIEYQL